MIASPHALREPPHRNARQLQLAPSVQTGPRGPSPAGASPPWHERLRRVFHLDAEAALPPLGRESLLQYHAYLSAQLCFPFPARYFDEREATACDNLITATRLVAAEECLRDPRAGIQCEVLACGYPVWVRLDELRLVDRRPGQQALDDYRSWFHAQR